MAKIDLDRLSAIAARALESGATRASQMRIEWDVAGKCEAPIGVELYAAPAADGKDKMVTIGPGTRHSLRVILSTRCRKCKPCLQMRRYLWTDRAKMETAKSTRTWFGTFTLTPERHDQVLNIARSKEAIKGRDFDALSYKEQFVKRHLIISRWLTLYLKRVRKESNAPFRYLLVAEAHKNGLPHYHALFHEQSEDNPLRYELLERQWTNGFSNFKLVDDPRQASYLCKYLSKTAAARVRASVRYGQELPRGI